MFDFMSQLCPIMLFVKVMYYLVLSSYTALFSESVFVLCLFSTAMRIGFCFGRGL